MRIKVVVMIFSCMLLPISLAAQTDSTITTAVDSIVATPITLDEAAPSQKLTSFSFSPSLGFTFQSTSKDDNEIENLQWLSQLQSRFSYEGPMYQFSASVFAQYGAFVTKEASPQKTQDHLQVSAVPSVMFDKGLGIRLFFEVTAETEMDKGMIDGVESRFLDPLFLYETLFLGHKTHLVSSDGNEEFEFVFGVGYAYQQTITDKFVLAENRQFVIDDNNPLSHVQDQFTVESGYSAILEASYSVAIGDNFSFRASTRNVVLTKSHFTEDIENCRVGSLILAGLQWKFLSLDYTMHILYDRNLSPRRELDQTMVFGFRLDI